MRSFSPFLPSVKCLSIVMAAGLLALAPCGAAEGEHAEELAEMKKVLKTISDETFAGKVEALLEHAHPALFAHFGKLLGSEKAARDAAPKLMRSDLDALEKMGFKITSYTVGEPEKVVNENNQLFVLVPTTMVAENPMNRITVTSHTLATRKLGAGEKWYLMRLGLPEDRIRAIITDLPKSFTWPAKTPPKVEQL